MWTQGYCFGCTIHSLLKVPLKKMKENIVWQCIYMLWSWPVADVHLQFHCCITCPCITYLDTKGFLSSCLSVHLSFCSSVFPLHLNVLAHLDRLYTFSLIHSCFVVMICHILHVTCPHCSVLFCPSSKRILSPS